MVFGKFTADKISNAGTKKGTQHLDYTATQKKGEGTTGKSGGESQCQR